MMFIWRWRRTRGKNPQSQKGSAQTRGSTLRSARPTVEQLEDRCVPSATVRFVTPTGAGTMDGLSWNNAATLQSALTSAGSGDQIWVEQGMYKPTTGTARDVYFELKDGVAVYGGFAGTETALGQRNFVTHVTTLSGDIGTANDNSDNSYHVVDTNGVSASAILDGFTITAGYANGVTTIEKKGGGLMTTSGAVTLNNLIVTGNYAKDAGGGMYSQTASPTLTNVTFRSNTTDAAGGGMDVNIGSPSLTNVVFDNNSAGLQGGGMANFGSSTPTLINVTFSRNFASAGSGLYDNTGSVATLTNCILWGNTGARQISGSATVSYSDVQGGFSGTGNIDADPRFIDAANGDLRLSRGSPAIDTGTNTGAPSFDRDNLTRPIQSTGTSPATTDMGAYEFQGKPPSASLSTAIFATSSVASGSTDLLTLIIKDTDGNAIASLTDSNFSLDLSGGTSTGSFDTVTETGTAGTYQTNFTGILAGTTLTLTVQVTGVTLDNKPTVAVTLGPPSASQSSASFANSTVGSGSTDLVTLVIKDAAGNSITGLLNADFNLSLSGGASTGSFDTVTETGTPGTYTTNFTGILAGTASTLTVQVKTVTLNDQPTVTVTPGQTDHLVMNGFPSTTTAGQAHSFTVTAVDKAGNTTDYSGAVIFSSDDPKAVLPPSGMISGGTGTFSATLKTAGSNKSISATSGSLTTSQDDIMVTPAAAKVLVFSQLPGSITPRVVFKVMVKIQDAYGNLVDSNAPVTISIASIKIRIAGIPVNYTVPPAKIGKWLAGTLTRNASGGIAVFDDLSLIGAGSSVNLRASSPGLTSATSVSIPIKRG